MAEPTKTTPSNATPPLPYGPVTIAELTEGLIWPRLLRTAVMAARPSRVFMAYALVLLITGIADVLVWWGSAGNYQTFLNELARGASMSWERACLQLTSLHPVAAMLDVFDGFVRQPIRMATEHPVPAAWTLAALAPFVLLLGAAISRSAALEAGPSVECKITGAIGFSARRWRTLLGAAVIPIVLVLFVALVIASFGWLLLGIPGVNAVAPILFGVLYALGFVLVLACVLYVLAWLLMIPAVTCDDSDAPDAIQRAYAYIVGRPGRALMYAGVLVLQGIIACAIADWLVTLTLHATESIALWWVPEESASRLHDQIVAKPGSATRILGGWAAACRMLFPAYVLSYLFTGATMQYLLLRRVNDEQDVEEVFQEYRAS